MNEHQTLGKILIIAGAVLAVSGILLYAFPKLLPGHLWGDIVIRKKNVTFYFPLMTSIILSILLSLILYFFRK